MSAQRGPYRKSYVVPHRTGFKYCRAVPKDLQPIEGKQAWVKYLGPVSRTVAETLAHALAYEHGRRILALRSDKVFQAPAADHAAWVCTRAPTPSPAGLAAPTLMDLIGLWERVRSPRSAISRARSRLCARRFIELVGKLDTRTICRSDAVAYREGLENVLHLRPKNVADHLGRVHVLFSVAMSEGWLPANPFQNIRPRNTTPLAPRRQGFSLEQVQEIFAALEEERVEFRWVLKLLAYHGMRSGEVCQLRCEDITVLHGVPVIRVHDLHGSLKNRASVRDVPIHPACMDIQTYAATAQGLGEGWLFPGLPVKSSGRGRWFQDYGSRFLRQKVGILDRCYTMHSFRHLWRTLARECEMPEGVSRSIMGHTLGEGDHGAYGTAPSLRLRAEWIAKINPLMG